ncbi:MAG: VapC toxin family PIN domain ribonuclease [Acidobacteria bacterium]|nr:MAG: VapC toxin family PIN domain ribonuclease [Acidobacteriota bacterium]
MTTIADTGALYALYDADDRHHTAVREFLEREPGPIIIPVAILAELDYLLREFLGIDAELDFLDGLLDGSFLLEPVTRSDLERCRELIAQYRGLDLGLADAAVIATAERLNVFRILTVDERDFRAVVSRDGKPFRLLPADS